MSMCGFVHMSASACQGQKRVLNLLELEFQAVVSHLDKGAGTKPQAPQEQYTLLIAEPSLI